MSVSNTIQMRLRTTKSANFSKNNLFSDTRKPFFYPASTLMVEPFLTCLIISFLTDIPNMLVLKNLGSICFIFEHFNQIAFFNDKKKTRLILR